MTLPAITARGVLHANGRHRTRTHMTGNAIASHLKIMRDGRRRPRQMRPAQTRRRQAHPVAGNEQFFRYSFSVALSAISLLRMGRYGRIPF